jgi:hypothetical protein
MEYLDPVLARAFLNTRRRDIAHMADYRRLSRIPLRKTASRPAHQVVRLNRRLLARLGMGLIALGRRLECCDPPQPGPRCLSVGDQSRF